MKLTVFKMLRTIIMVITGTVVSEKENDKVYAFKR